jgi:hypothetical protein
MPAVVENDRSVVYALSLYFAWLAVSLTVLIWTVAKGDPVTIDFAYCVVASAMVLAWCVPAAARRAVAEGLRRVRPLWCVVGAASGVVTFSVAGALVYGFNHLFELAEYSYTDHLFDAGWGWGMSILVVAVQPAIFEELAFRGVVFSALRRVLESREAVLVTALMFMILHLSVLSFPHLLLIGLVLGWLRVRTGSLVPGMFLHFTHNLLCVAWERYWAA